MMDALKPYWGEIRLALWAFAFTAVFCAGFHVGELRSAERLAKAKQTTAEQTTAAVQSARATEHAQADGFAAIDTKFQGDLSYAKSLSASTVAGLRDGTVRMRPAWRCPAAVPAPAASASKPDGGADDQAASAGRIVRAAADADAQIAALQELLRKERE